MIKSRRGFTIVELLIVIVVIAILAAITIVAFNGIQTNAENNKTISGLQAYVKAFSMYAADNGQYPSNAYYPCLGDYNGSTTCARVVDGGGCAYSGGTSVNATFDAMLSPYLGAKKPSMSTQRTECNGDMFMGAYANANNTNPKALTIPFYIKGDLPCPVVAGIQLTSRLQTGTTTRCVVTMPTLP